MRALATFWPAVAEMSVLLEVSDLRVRYPVRGRLSAWIAGEPAMVDAVAGVSFSIAMRETFAIVGELGIGQDHPCAGHCRAHPVIRRLNPI